MFTYNGAHLQGEPRKTLLVEDDERIRRIVEKILRERGHAVTAVGDGETAWKILESEFFPLVVLDWMLPGVSGVALCERLRRRPAGDYTTVLIMTARGKASDWQEALDAGADDYLVKPFEIQALDVRLSVAEARAREKLARRLADEERQNSEERIQQILETIPDVVYRLDSAGRFVHIGPGIRALGYEPEELLGYHFGEIIHPEDLPRVSRAIVLPALRGYRTGDDGAPKLFDEKRTGPRRTTFLEVRLRPRGRRLRTGELAVLCEVCASGIYDRSVENPQKTLVGTVGLIRDISARLQAEENARRLNSLLETSRDVSRLVARQPRLNQLVIDVCQRLIATEGIVGAAVLAGSGGLEIGAAAGLDETFFARWYELAREGRPAACVAAAGVEPRPAESDACAVCGLAANCPLRAALGARLSWSGKDFGVFFLIPSDLPGATETASELIEQTAGDLAFACHSQELGREHQQALGAQRLTEEKYRELFESLLQGALDLDADGLIRAANPAAVRLLGLPVEDLIGRNWLDENWGWRSEDEETLPPERHPLAQALRTGREVHGVLLGMANQADGECRWLEISCLPRQAPGETRPSQVLAAFTDVTDRRQNQEALVRAERMAAVGQLAGGLAHDFNNQLMAILGYGDIILQSLPEGHECRQFAEVITSTALKSSELTRKLLAFSRKNKAKSLPVDVHALVAEVVGLVSHSFDRNIEIRQELNAPAPVVIGDQNQLQNAIMNLLVNARDAMPQGGTLTLATRAEAIEESDGRDYAIAVAPGNYFCLEVRDSGTGMPPEVRRRIFEPFFTTKGKGRGTGLGLSGVYGALQAHGGTIRVESVSGQGSAFFLYLPLPRQSGEHEPLAPPPATRPGEAIKGAGTLLVVDDEETMLDLLSDMLGGLGYKVLTCSDGEKALEIFRRDPQAIDLVVLDLILPRVSGSEVFRALREIRPGVPVLLSSGCARDRAASILRDGASDFVEKPYRADILSWKLAKLLKLGEKGR